MLNFKYLLLYFSLASKMVIGQEVIVDSLFFEETQDYRTYKVCLPVDYDSTRTYQTIYCLDGDFLFNILAANVEIYADPFIGFIPPTIVVGVFFDQRNDDMGIDWRYGVLNDRGRAFKELIKESLVPMVSNKYSVSEYRTIVGHSNSSTFAHFFLEGESPLFKGYLTLSQFQLFTDVLNYSKLNLKNNIDLVAVSGGLDMEYRVESGKVLEELLDSLAIDKLVHSHVFIPNANHLTIVPQGIPLALEELYKDYGKKAQAKDVIAAGCLKFQSPIEVVDSINNMNVEKYGIDFSYSVDDLDLLFELYVEVRDSVGVSKATKIHADLSQDSTEYFYEAQCLEMMGAHHSAEKSYLRHLNYSSYIGYWSYIRLVWLYANKLNDEVSAIKWCATGLKNLKDDRFINELVKITDKYPESLDSCIKVLHEYVADTYSAELQFTAQASLAKLYRKAGDIEKALYYEDLVR